MQKISCIIIDDEPLARKGLKEYIAEVDFLDLNGEYNEPLKAVKQITDGSIQLIFLDIQMPRITGLDFLKSIKQPPPVIFTTAYPQYALEGFELNALDYLVKPVSFDRFLKAVLKVKEFYEVRQKNKSVPQASEEYFFIKADNKLVRILHDEILFIEALQNYIAVHTVFRKYITYLTFKSIEEYLPENRFIKTHKSYIVSASKIDNIEGNVISIGSHQVPISRTSREEVIERLLKGRYLRR